MKIIQLTRGQVTLVDDADYAWLNQWKWHAHFKHGWYAMRGIRVNGKNKSIKMHRLILGLTNPKIFGDHRNGNGLDNQRHNLRVATHGQNSANRKAKNNGSSKYLGVSYNKNVKAKKKWIAYITKNSKHIHLGSYNTESEAAIVYDTKAKELHGEFANLNFK